MTTQHPEVSKTSVAAAPLLTKKQVAAGLLAKERASKIQWKSLIAEAQATWPQVSTAELMMAEGNVHALAGLVQLRQRVSRADSDQQVKAFFAAQPAPDDATPQTG